MEKTNDFVFHDLFGFGYVIEDNGKVITVIFDNANKKLLAKEHQLVHLVNKMVSNYILKINIDSKYDEASIKRSLDYSNKISTFIVDKGNIDAIILGTRPYAVSIRYNYNAVRVNCDCVSVSQGYCVHEIALLTYLKSFFLKLINFGRTFQKEEVYPIDNLGFEEMNDDVLVQIPDTLDNSLIELLDLCKAFTVTKSLINAKEMLDSANRILNQENIKDFLDTIYKEFTVKNNECIINELCLSLELKDVFEYAINNQVTNLEFITFIKQVKKDTDNFIKYINPTSNIDSTMATHYYFYQGSYLLFFSKVFGCYATKDPYFDNFRPTVIEYCLKRLPVNADLLNFYFDFGYNFPELKPINDIILENFNNPELKESITENIAHLQVPISLFAKEDKNIQFLMLSCQNHDEIFNYFLDHFDVRSDWDYYKLISYMLSVFPNVAIPTKTKIIVFLKRVKGAELIINFLMNQNKKLDRKLSDFYFIKSAKEFGINEFKKIKSEVEIDFTYLNYQYRFIDNGTSFDSVYSLKIQNDIEIAKVIKKDDRIYIIDDVDKNLMYGEKVFDLIEANPDFIEERREMEDKILSAIDAYNIEDLKNKISSTEQDFRKLETSRISDVSKPHLAYSFIITNSEKSVSLKLGNTKMYTIKVIGEFLKLFNKLEFKSYGKEFGFYHSLENLDYPDTEVLQILLNNQGRIGSDKKSLVLSDYNLSKVIELLVGNNVLINEKPVYIRLNEMNIHPFINKNYRLQVDLVAPFDYYYLNSKLYIERENVLDIIKASNKELLMNKFFLENNEVSIKRVIDQFKEAIYAKFTDKISLAPEIVGDFKLSEMVIKAYFDYVDKQIRVNTKLFKNGFEVTLAEANNDVTKYREYLHYLNQMGFVNSKITTDEGIYNFFCHDFSDIKQYATVYLSDSIQNKIVKKFIPSKLIVKHENSMLDVFMSESEYTVEELARIIKDLRNKKKYTILNNNTIIDLTGREAEEFSDLVSDLSLTAEELEKGVNRPVYHSFKLLGNKNIQMDEYVSGMISEIANFKKSKALLPKVNASLRIYQIEGFYWLDILRKYHLGGILADDMGLGKTLEIITAIKANPTQKPSIIICPKSLVFNWVSEYDKFDPETEVKEIYGLIEDRVETIKEINPNNKVIYITSYDSLRNDIKDYDIDFEYVILDEAQTIKNIMAQKSKTVKSLKGNNRLALTGTPIENNLLDLWSIFDFIMPNYLDDLGTFKNNMTDDDYIKRLEVKIRPFILRRNKKDVLEDLPSKFERIITCEMQPYQRKVYDAEIKKAKDILDNGGKAFDVLPMLLRLRQICIDPSLFIDNYQGESTKMELLMDILTDYYANNHQILVFSSFVGCLNIIKAKLEELNLKYYMLTGDTKAPDRIDLVNTFNNSKDPSIFLISLKAGGTGLNLVGADTVIHVDPWWNSAAENQATDRAYRIGQKRNVEVIKLIVQESIEKRVIELQNIKQDLIDKLIAENDEKITKLSLDDIKYILK